MEGSSKTRASFWNTTAPAQMAPNSSSQRVQQLFDLCKHVVLKR